MNTLSSLLNFIGDNLLVTKQIVSNTDLNNITQKGRYYCVSASSASTLTNCPATTNFVMFVMKKSDELQTQIIFEASKMYTRSRTSTGWSNWSRVTGGNPPVGTIQMYAGSTLPSGWQWCNGAALSRSTYPELFAAIGTTYGAGDGSTTFNVPDLRGRFPLMANSAHALASKGGSEDLIVPYHRHSVAKVTGGITGGSHNHSFRTHNNSGSASGYVQEVTSSSVKYSDTNVSTETHTHDLPAHNTAYAGTSGNDTGANMPPFLTVNFIIYKGV